MKVRPYGGQDGLVSPGRQVQHQVGAPSLSSSEWLTDPTVPLPHPSGPTQFDESALSSPSLRLLSAAVPLCSPGPLAIERRNERRRFPCRLAAELPFRSSPSEFSVDLQIDGISGRKRQEAS